MSDSLSRDHVWWVLFALLGGLALFHQVANAFRAPADTAMEPAELVWTDDGSFSKDAFVTPPVSSGPAEVAELQVLAEEVPEVGEPEPVIIENRQQRVSDLLVEAIVQIESAGNPKCVGPKGERGLMQIKRETWKDMTTARFGSPVSFDEAFNPALNRFVGRLYLDYLQRYIRQHKDKWQGDERSMLLAAYNAGPKRLRQADFDVNKLSKITRSYVRRGSDLHAFYLRTELGETEPVAFTELLPAEKSPTGMDLL